VTAWRVPWLDDRLRVAVADDGHRTQSMLRAYLNGSGRALFETADTEDAQCLIADCDHPAARRSLQRFRARDQRPAIVLAQRNPSLPGTVWVPKPVDLAALDLAAHRVRTLMQPGLAEAAFRPFALDQAGAAARSSLTLVSRPPGPLPERAGPYRMGGSARLDGQDRLDGPGCAGDTAFAASLGWRPAVEGRRPPTRSAQPAGPAAAGQDALRRAVKAALQEPYRPRAEERERLKGLLEAADWRLALEPSGPAWLKLGLNPEVMSVSPQALPAALLAEGAPLAARVERELALKAAVAP
jgi:hypothetical protein